MSSLANQLICPITKLLMSDPVKAPDGHTYERYAIVRALEMTGKSPITRQNMNASELITDFTILQLLGSLSNNTDQLTATETTVKDPKTTVTLRRLDNVSQLTLSTPDGETAPKNVVFVVDISGSMNEEVKTPNGESDGFNILDVIKHGILVSLLGFRPCDKACIIVYSTEARILLPLRKMDAGGKGLAKVALAGIGPENCTNIWSGLKLAINQLQEGGTIFLLTDGKSNVIPPRGEKSMLMTEMDGRDDIVLNTFGVGYNLDSNLLVELARTTQGSYSFIPGIGLVGTVFVHAMANLLTLTNKKWTVAIETEGFIENLDIVSGLENRFIKTSWGYCLPIGQLPLGQSRDIHIQCDKPVTFSILDTDIHILGSNPAVSDCQKAGIGIFKCHQLARENPSAVGTHLNELLGTITDPLIREDVNGQVREAIEPSAYKTWGRHYMPSLGLSHLMQQCNNFIDKGIQQYGGSHFQSVRDNLDKLFNEMQAPVPTHRQRVVARCQSAGQVVSARPVSMSHYNRSDGPCFAGPCRVKVPNGVKCCCNIKKNDIVMTSDGPAKIRCVLRTQCENSTAQLIKLDTLMITPYHPIIKKKKNGQLNDKWTFPNDHGKAEDYQCEAVFSFLLEPGFQDMIIEGVQCITLAHGIENDPVASHPFYGTDKVIETLKTHMKFDDGYIELVGECIQRDKETNLVCGFNF